MTPRLDLAQEEDPPSPEPSDWCRAECWWVQGTPHAGAHFWPGLSQLGSCALHMSLPQGPVAWPAPRAGPAQPLGQRLHQLLWGRQGPCDLFTAEVRSVVDLAVLAMLTWTGARVVETGSARGRCWPRTGRYRSPPVPPLTSFIQLLMSVDLSKAFALFLFYLFIYLKKYFY